MDKKIPEMRPRAEKTLKMGPKNFTPKLNLFKIFCPRFQIAFQFYGQTITSNIVFQQITFFLPSNNHLDLTLNETNIKINSYFSVASHSYLALIHHPYHQCMYETVNKKFKKFQQKVWSVFLNFSQWLYFN